MLETPTDIGSFAAPRLAIAVLGSIGATVIAVVIALVTTTELGGFIGFVGVGVAVVAALWGLPVVSYLTSLDAMPAAAVTLFLAGGLIPASLGINVIPGVSIDDIPTIVAILMSIWWTVMHRSTARIVKLAVPLILLIGWVVIAWGLMNPSLRVLLVGPGRWTMYALMVIVAAIWFRKPDLRWWFLGVLITLSFGQALFSIWAYHSDWLMDGRFIGIERFRWYQPLVDDVNGRTTGLLGIASNFFGAYTLLPGFASLGIAIYSRSVWVRTAMLSVFAVLAYSGILSYTRATLIGLVLGTVGFLVFARPYKLAPAVVAIVVLAVITTPILSRFSEGNDRANLASQAGSTILDNPFTGVGSGEYVPGESVDEDGSPTVTPHNSLLLQASETGVLGGVLLLVAILVLLAGVWGGNIPRRAGPGLIATAVFAGLGAVLIQTMSNNLLHIPPIATQFWLTGTAGVSFAAAAGGRWAEYLLSPILNRAQS